MLKLSRESLKPDMCSTHDKHHLAKMGQSSIVKRDFISVTTRQACHSTDWLLDGVLGIQVKQPGAGLFMCQLRDTVMLQGGDRSSEEADNEVHHVLGNAECPGKRNDEVLSGQVQGTKVHKC